MRYLHCYSDQKRYRASIISGLFRCTYSDECFSTTRLYSTIREYEENKSVVIWK